MNSQPRSSLFAEFYPTLRDLRETLQGLKEYTLRAYDAEPQRLWVQQHAQPRREPLTAEVQRPLVIDDRKQEAYYPWRDDATRQFEAAQRRWVPLWYACFTVGTDVPVYDQSGRHFTTDRDHAEQVLITDPTKRWVLVFFANFSHGPIGKYLVSAGRLTVGGPSPTEGHVGTGETRSILRTVDDVDDDELDETERRTDRDAQDVTVDRIIRAWWDE